MPLTIKPGEGRERLAYDNDELAARIVPYEYGAGWQIKMAAHDDLAGLAHLGLSSSLAKAREEAEKVWALVKCARGSPNYLKFFHHMCADGLHLNWPVGRVEGFYLLATGQHELVTKEMVQ
jgi:hypothetical protein